MYFLKKTAVHQSPGLYREIGIFGTERKCEANQFYHSEKYISLSHYNYSIYRHTYGYICVHTHSQILSSAMRTLFPFKYRSHTHSFEGKTWTQQLDFLM